MRPLKPIKRPSEEIEQLRQAAARARRSLPPEQVFETTFPDGTVMRETSESLIETAQAAVDFADAEQRGDEEAMKDALRRLGIWPLSDR